MLSRVAMLAWLLLLLYLKLQIALTKAPSVWPDEAIYIHEALGDPTAPMNWSAYFLFLKCDSPINCYFSMLALNSVLTTAASLLVYEILRALHPPGKALALGVLFSLWPPFLAYSWFAMLDAALLFVAVLAIYLYTERCGKIALLAPAIMKPSGFAFPLAIAPFGVRIVALDVLLLLTLLGLWGGLLSITNFALGCLATVSGLYFSSFGLILLPFFLKSSKNIPLDRLNELARGLLIGTAIIVIPTLLTLPHAVVLVRYWDAPILLSYILATKMPRPGKRLIAAVFIMAAVSVAYLYLTGQLWNEAIFSSLPQLPQN